MIEKDELLQRCRLHFTILPEFERDHGRRVRLAGGIQSEDVRFTFDRADHRVHDRRQQEGVSREDQHQQRESGRIRNSVHTPARATFLNDAIEYCRSQTEPDEDKNRERHRHLGAMIKNVMAHLVRHHFTNFRQGALIEKIVVKSDPRRSG